MSSYSGTNRYNTSAKIVYGAIDLWSDYDGVIIASGDSYADALAASGLSGLLCYPILLSAKDSLDSSTKTALSRLVAARGSKLDIIVVGGTSAVSDNAVNAVTTYDSDASVTRISGGNRYETSDAIYAYGASIEGSSWNTSYAIVTTGANYADALSIAPYASAYGAPILLTDGSLSQAQCQALPNYRNAIVLGGSSVISDETLNEVNSLVAGNVKRLAGQTRYDTCTEIVEWELSQGMSIEGAGLATGANFPDALSCGFYLGLTNSVLILMDPTNCYNNGALNILEEQATWLKSVKLFGGTSAIPETVRASIERALIGTSGFSNITSKTKVGKTVTFGLYEQDANTRDGKEAIEWIVLDNSDGYVTLISKYALDTMAYANKLDSTTWETSAVRSWLNGTFYNTAFSPNEKEQIAYTYLPTNSNYSYGTSGGNATCDYVYLQSIEEAEYYFSSDSKRICYPTDFALSQGAYLTEDGACCWWLRSPGYTSSTAAVTDGAGAVGSNVFDSEARCYSYGNVNLTDFCVRPVIRVKVS